MVKDLTETMFEAHGEPKLFNSEIGHVFLIDRGIPLGNFTFENWSVTILSVCRYRLGYAALLTSYIRRTFRRNIRNQMWLEKFAFQAQYCIFPIFMKFGVVKEWSSLDRR